MDCSVCCLPYTQMLRKKIECPFCMYPSCVDCIKKFMLLSVNDPTCMSCKQPWTRDFIDSFTSKTFRDNDYKKHREMLLVDREKSLLPATVPYVAQAKRKKELKIINDALAMEKKALVKKIAEIDKKYYENLAFIEGGEVPLKPEEEKKVFTRACVVEGCRGFLSSKWKCGVCNVYVCHECNEPKGEGEHVCNPDNVATAKMIAKDSKSCPKCAMMISRVSGCDLMFCTICHVSFSWNKGTIVETTQNHNPHYLEYIRQTNNGFVPRAPGDIPLTCGGFPEYRILDSFMKKHNKEDPRIAYLFHFIQVLYHVYEYEVQPRRQVASEEAVNRDFRLKYLMNDITEEEWKKALQKRERKREIAQARRQVFEMLCVASSDLLYKLISLKELKDITKVLDEMQTLIDYFNESSMSINKRFGLKSMKKISTMWTLS